MHRLHSVTMNPTPQVSNCMKHEAQPDYNNHMERFKPKIEEVYIIDNIEFSEYHNENTEAHTNPSLTEPSEDKTKNDSNHECRKQISFENEVKVENIMFEEIDPTEANEGNIALKTEYGNDLQRSVKEEEVTIDEMNAVVKKEPVESRFCFFSDILDQKSTMFA